MTTRCGRCKASAYTGDLLRCFGRCKVAFHPNCIDYKMDHWSKLLKECPYAKFVCFNCQQDTEGNTWAEIVNLSDHIREVSKSMNSLNNKIETRFELLETNLSEKIDQLKQNNNDVSVDLSEADEKFDLLDLSDCSDYVASSPPNVTEQQPASAAAASADIKAKWFLDECITHKKPTVVSIGEEFPAPIIIKSKLMTRDRETRAPCASFTIGEDRVELDFKPNWFSDDRLPAKKKSFIGTIGEEVGIDVLTKTTTV